MGCKEDVKLKTSEPQQQSANQSINPLSVQIQLCCHCGKLCRSQQL